MLALEPLWMTNRFKTSDEDLINWTIWTPIRNFTDKIHLTCHMDDCILLKLLDDVLFEVEVNTCERRLENETNPTDSEKWKHQQQPCWIFELAFQYWSDFSCTAYSTTNCSLHLSPWLKYVVFPLRNWILGF